MEGSRPRSAPISVTDHRNTRRARLLVFLGDRAPQQRRDAQSGEILSGHHLAVGQRRLAVQAHRDVLLAETEGHKRENAGKCLVLSSELLKCGIGKGQSGIAAGLAEMRRPFVRVPFEQHELLGMIHRRFLEHDSVNEAEDRRVRANSQRSDLLRVFTTEGGLSTRTHRTYVLKQFRLSKLTQSSQFQGTKRKTKSPKSHGPI